MTATERTHAIYFDLDGTLVNSLQSCVLATQETFKSLLNVDIPDSAIVEQMGIPIEVSFRTFGGEQVTDILLPRIIEDYRARYRPISDKYTVLYDGIAGMLETLAGLPCTLHIATSKKTAIAKQSLATLGVDHYFTSIIGSDLVSQYKPHPETIFHARASLSGITPRGEMTVGDADTDIFMGKGAGTKTCAVTWGAHDTARLERAKPDHMAHTVADLNEIFLAFVAG